ncbi:hypothetical protein QQ045_000548 [Rhodiola kirilowii]
MRHPADSLQWVKVDNTILVFGSKSRNLRLGLCTDGVNLHGNLSSQRSTWPVILVIYNLPPRLTMQRRYMMLSLLISGPRRPGNHIDVYLAPLIDDQELLWNEGVRTFDAARQEYFNMCDMLMCTINDFPTYGVKVPYGFSSNIASLVSMKDLRLNGLKSHNYHTLIQQLLPIALRGILPPKVRAAEQRLCVIFSSLCAKVVDPIELDRLQEQVVVTLC